MVDSSRSAGVLVVQSVAKRPWSRHPVPGSVTRAAAGRLLPFTDGRSRDETHQRPRYSPVLAYLKGLNPRESIAPAGTGSRQPHPYDAAIAHSGLRVVLVVGVCRPLPPV